MTFDNWFYSIKNNLDETLELGLSVKPFLEKAYQLGKEEVMESWKKAFLHCSSPYCASTHLEVCFSGELGNMEKKECTAKQ